MNNPNHDKTKRRILSMVSAILMMLVLGALLDAVWLGEQVSACGKPIRA